MLHFFSNVIFGNSNVKPVDLRSFEESPESSASESNTTTGGTPIDGNTLKIVKKKIPSEKSDIDLNNSAFRDALQAIESAPNIRDPTCVNLLFGIDGIQYLDDGHWQLLRNKLCGKLSRLDRRLWSGNGSNICGNKIVTSWRGACSNRGATNKSSNVSKHA